MARYAPYGYRKQQPMFVPRPFDPVDTARYEEEERAWNVESFSWYRPFPSIHGWYANGCLPQRGPEGWIMVSPKWQAQSNPTSPMYTSPAAEERGATMYSPTAHLDPLFAEPYRHDRVSPLTLGPPRKADAATPQGSVLMETMVKGRSIVFECGVGEQQGAKGTELDEEEEEEEEVVFTHAPDPHAGSEEDEVPLSSFVVDGQLKAVANVEPGVYMDDDEAENGKFAWKWTPAKPEPKPEPAPCTDPELLELQRRAIELRPNPKPNPVEEKSGGGGDSDFYDD